MVWGNRIFSSGALMLFMERQEHIHIVAAGEKMEAACAAAVRDLQDITRIVIFADTEIFTNTSRDSEEVKTHKDAVREAVTEAKAHAATLNIPAILVYIAPPAGASVAAAVQKIKRESPGARFTFDLSGGSKDLAVALFQISLWLGGGAYYAFEGRKGTVGPAEKLAVPAIPLKEIAANPNYMRILAVLAGTPGKNDTAPRVLPRSYLFTQLEAFYVPVKKSGVKMNVSKTKTDAVTGKRAAIPVLSQGTFSSLLTTLASADLVQEVPGPAGNRKEKYYRITASGTLALQLV
ncbi:hypothetical protein [Methanoregula sp.]|uniref:hypothetical protein n=1 Tax=Methanoregula sp. TaxID=2052170 RepID=UPI00356AD377